MKLPLIKSIIEYSDTHSIEDVQTTIDVLEHLTQGRGLSAEEIDLTGELISNLYGAIEVNKLVQSGEPQRDALNKFMQRVMGSIDR